MHSPSRIRRLIAAAAVAGLAALALVGCGSSKSGNTDANGVTTLTWWDYFGYSPASDAAVKSLISKYEAAHSNVKITRTSVGFADFHTKLVQAAATGKLVATLYRSAAKGVWVAVDDPVLYAERSTTERSTTERSTGEG